MASNKLAERLARRQPVTIDQPAIENAPPQPAGVPATHREKLAQRWKRVATVLPPEEHQAFKIAALRHDQEMSDVIRDLIKAWLEDQS